MELARAVLERFRQVNGALLAGFVAFRLFLFLVPLIFLVVGVLGLAGSLDVSVDDATSGAPLLGYVSEALRTAAADAEVGFSTFLLVGLSVLIPLLGLTGAVYLIYAQAWGLPLRPSGGRPRRLGAVLAGFSLLLAGAMFAAAVSTSIPGTAAAMASVTVVNGLVYVAIAAFMPRRSSRIRELLPGAIVTAVGMLALSGANNLILRSFIASRTATMGLLGAVTVIMLILLVMAVIITLGAVTNAVWWARSTGQELPPPVLSIR